MKFEKWQALGNDYLIIERADLGLEPSPSRIEMICDRHFGLGGDGVLLVEPSIEEGIVAEIRIFNPDGSEAELSGNGIRQAVLYLRAHGWTDLDTFAVSTRAGEIRPTILADGRCEVWMGLASLTSEDFPTGNDDGRGTVAAGGREWEFQYVSIGNPQCAIEVGSELEDLDLGLIGPEIENSGLFPNRTNVSFYRASGGRVRARIFERGVGETLSSGTGASGAAIAAHLGGAPDLVTVELDGGELEVAIGEDLSVTLTGWAKPVFAGEASAEFVQQITEAPG